MTKATRRSSRKRMVNRAGSPGAQTPFSIMKVNPKGIAVAAMPVNRAARRAETASTGVPYPRMLIPWRRNTAINRAGGNR